MQKEKLKAIFSVIIIVFLFIVVSYLVQSNSGYFGLLIDKSNVFVFSIIFVLLLIMATVVAPVTLMPIIPLASFAYGWFYAGLLSIVGWTIGSVIAFLIARKFGVPLIGKLVSLKQIRRIESKIPSENVFWAVVFLRITIPVDVLSYALGLFSKITLKNYFLATLIGITPMAFLIAYAGTLEIQYQILAFTFATLIVILLYLIKKKYELWNIKKSEKFLTSIKYKK